MKLYEAKAGYEYVDGEYLDLDGMSAVELVQLGLKAHQRLANATDECAMLKDVYERRFGSTIEAD